MSLISETSPKHCAKKGLSIEKRHKKLFFTFSTLFTTLLFIIFLLWLTLHPTKPNFSLTQADIYQLNLSAPTHLLNSSIQLTLFSKNPNKKVGIYYDRLLVYAAYRGQQITPETLLPPFYQSHEESNLLTAFLEGNGLPVAPSFGYQVGHDRTNGKLVMGLKLDGKLRWRVGTWVSGAYRFNVDCVALVAFGPYISTAPLASIQGTRCSTTI
ncbi:PREDICTED: NDR1/HIN1-like protein 12 [Tarenaya hassleriana]|uniref:NDR1/HIN1-like protein 12 n=1 Tax=Tarenaya hassleriana TaxID=28532 RepID=UPI00053C91BC|nr:PREDICTED: NDR1/HIN1-like protein 12 [Tarenaya hassleriana]XP_010520937.1 PREDICTED: NDR1/HIN1-like protein 12 [Tarenaya hassleriana]